MFLGIARKIFCFVWLFVAFLTFQVLETETSLAQGVDENISIEVLSKPVIGHSVFLRGKLNKPDGEGLLSLSWSLASKPSNSVALLTLGSGIEASLVPDVAGVYAVTLSISESSGVVLTKTVSFNTSNNKPTADAGLDQFLAVAKTAALSAVNSYDIYGNKLSYTWTLLHSPDGSSAQISNANQLRPSIVPDVEGDYIIQLVVTDEHGLASEPSLVVVSTLGGKPFAKAGADRSIALGQSISLNPFGSYHTGGEQMSVAWSIVKKPTTSGATIVTNSNSRSQFIPDVEGSYLLLLSVDDGSEKSFDTLSVEVGQNVNTTVKADAGRDQAVVVGTNVLLSGLKTYDLDGDSLTYHWSVISRPLSSVANVADINSPVANFTVDVAGDYVVQLIVSDGKSSDIDTVLISTGNVAPNVQVNLVSLLDSNLMSNVSAANSFDANGDALDYQWSIAGLVNNLPLNGQFSQVNQSQTAISFSSPSSNTIVENYLRDYSAIVFKRMISKGEIEGKVFVGGNLKSRRSKIGFGMLNANGQDVLTVKKNIRGQRIRIVSGGNVKVGRNVQANLGLSGGGVLINDPSIDVNSKKNALIELSNQLKNLTPNSVVEFNNMPSNWHGINSNSWNNPNWFCQYLG